MEKIKVIILFFFPLSNILMNFLLQQSIKSNRHVLHGWDRVTALLYMENWAMFREGCQ